MTAYRLCLQSEAPGRLQPPAGKGQLVPCTCLLRFRLEFWRSKTGVRRQEQDGLRGYHGGALSKYPACLESSAALTLRRHRRRRQSQIVSPATAIATRT
jgi:hypothetical protein